MATDEQVNHADEGRRSSEGLGLAASAPKPRAWALPIAEMAGGGDYLRSTPSLRSNGDPPLEWVPLYDHAAIDAAVATERERISLIADEIESAWPEGRQTASMIREGVTVLASHVCADVSVTRAQERERCAKLVESRAGPLHTGAYDALIAAAAAIREA